MLQDVELEALLLQSDIRDLEQEKVQLGESLLEKQRELLAWEKKLQMAQETKQSIQYERGKEGDIGTMKAEIHRMEVRCILLTKLQTELSPQDLCLLYITDRVFQYQIIISQNMLVTLGSCVGHKTYFLGTY
jgi:hypothetical protein